MQSETNNRSCRVSCLAQEIGLSELLRKGAKRKHMPIRAQIITTAATAANMKEEYLVEEKLALNNGSFCFYYITTWEGKVWSSRGGHKDRFN